MGRRSGLIGYNSGALLHFPRGIPDSGFQNLEGTPEDKHNEPNVCGTNTQCVSCQLSLRLSDNSSDRLPQMNHALASLSSVALRIFQEIVDEHGT